MTIGPEKFCLRAHETVATDLVESETSKKLEYIVSWFIESIDIVGIFPSFQTICPTLAQFASVAIIATKIPLHLSSTTSGTALHTLSSHSSSHPPTHSGKYWRTLKAFVMAGEVFRVLSLFFCSAATAAASFSAPSCSSCCARSLVEACYAACTYCVCAWNSQEINTINTLIANFRLRYFFFAKFRHWDKRCSQTHLHCLRCRRRRHPFLHLRRVWKSCSHMCVYCKYKTETDRDT